MDISQTDIDTCIRVLAHYAENRQHMPNDIKTVVSKFNKQKKVTNSELLKRDACIISNFYKKNRVDTVESDTCYEQLLVDNAHLLDTCNNMLPSSETEMAQVTLHKSCYVCKQKYRLLHPFYETMCVQCGDFNYEKRMSKADLSGKIAIVTGCRIKIGFEIAKSLLRNGATVIGTTRFPEDAQTRFSLLPDYGEWSHRLKIYGINMLDLKAVYNFCFYIKETYSELHIIINNAAQTIWKPEEYYSNLLKDSDTKMITDCSHDKQIQKSVTYDKDLQIMDNRFHNTWSSKIADVPIVELLEVHIINSFAPFIICAELKELMANTPGNKFINNVSAMEGIFDTKIKSARHPHTNMAKASLNMITRTCAYEYAAENIYMNSSDTGWVTDERPVSMKTATSTPVIIPLDELDGAMRVLDPIYMAINNPDKKPVFGKFLKDYVEAKF